MFAFEQEKLTIDQAEHRNEILRKLIGFYSAQHGCCCDYTRALVTRLRLSTYSVLRQEYELAFRLPCEEVED